MNRFTSFIRRIKGNPWLSFLEWTAFFFLLFIGIYIGLLCTDFSTAPQFLYNQF